MLGYIMEAYRPRVKALRAEWSNGTHYFILLVRRVLLTEG